MNLRVVATNSKHHYWAPTHVVFQVTEPPNGLPPQRVQSKDITESREERIGLQRHLIAGVKGANE